MSDWLVEKKRPGQLTQILVAPGRLRATARNDVSTFSHSSLRRHNPQKLGNVFFWITATLSNKRRRIRVNWPGRFFHEPVRDGLYTASARVLGGPNK